MSDFDALCGQRIEHLWREMQTGCGRGDRPAFVREDCLVAIAICVYIVAMNVRRQRDVADAIQNVEEMGGKEAVAD